MLYETYFLVKLLSLKVLVNNFLLLMYND